MKYLIIMLFIIPMVMGNPYTELNALAIKLNVFNDSVTVRNIDIFVEQEITQKFFWRPRGITTTWDEKLGDCTDQAMIKHYLIYKNGIKVRLVHGFIFNYMPHDWVEVKINNKWENTEARKVKNVRKIGYGVW